MARHLCPVCQKVAGRGTFNCVGCGMWVHPKCGGYTPTEVQNLAKAGKEDELRCNDCKKVIFHHFIYLYRHLRMGSVTD